MKEKEYRLSSSKICCAILRPNPREMKLIAAGTDPADIQRQNEQVCLQYIINHPKKAMHIGVYSHNATSIIISESFYNLLKNAEMFDNNGIKRKIFDKNGYKRAIFDNQSYERL